jgi:hypothetical protein
MARINVESIYEVDESQIFCIGDYEAMVDAFANRTIVSANDDDDSQGSSYRLIADGDEPGQAYGVLFFEWESCNGSDALQSCQSFKEVQRLADSLQDSIKWFSDKEALSEYVRGHDWEKELVWHQLAFHAWLQGVLEFLDSEQK